MADPAVPFDVGLRIQPRFRLREYSRPTGVTPDELVEDLRAVIRQLQRVGAESSALIAYIAALERLLNGASPAVRAAFEAVKLQAGAVIGALHT